MWKTCSLLGVPVMNEDAPIHWRSLTLDDEGWKRVRCLYAYLAPETREILYIGKAWNATVVPESPIHL